MTSRQRDPVTALAATVIAIVTLITIGVVGVGLWAVVRIVEHFT